MGLKSKKLPILIIAIGLVAAIAAYMFTAVVYKPAVTEYDFEYSVTYTLNGETHTFEDVYRCSFVNMGRDGDPRDRYYEGVYVQSEGSDHPGTYTIDEKDGLELRLVTIFTNDYLMGDGDQHFTNQIYLAAFDDMGVEYVEPEILEKFDVELVSYELPQPIENSFVFSGFSILHDESMIAMLAVGILVILACIILVKRDEGVEYRMLDNVSIAFNCIIGFLGIPFIFIVVWWSQIYTSLDSLQYQIDLCIPAISVFAIAASVCLRRKGYTKSGFFIQFLGPVLFVLSLILESILL